MKHRPKGCLMLLGLLATVVSCGKRHETKSIALNPNELPALEVQSARVELATPGAAVAAGELVAFKGRFELKNPDSSKPLAASVLRFSAKNRDGKSVIHNEEVAPTKPVAEGTYEFSAELKAPAKPGKYAVEVRNGRTTIATTEVEVQPKKS